MTLHSQNQIWLERLKACECPDSTYRPKPFPMVMAAGLGSLLTDVEGRSYIDLCAGFGVLALGHNPPGLSQALAEVPLTQGFGDVYPSSDKILYLEELTRLKPGLTHGAFALSGGQAVEIAMKTAMLATRGDHFIAFDGAYHGLDLGVLPVTSRQQFKEPFEGFLTKGGVSFLAYGCPLEDFEEAIKTLKKSRKVICGVVVEPVQGRAGVRVPPQGWLEGISEICQNHDVLLIFDEIFTGLGRLGELVSPVPCDLLCLGKSLGGGLPLSVCLGRKDVMDAWPECTAEAIHTGTFFGHPLACRLGLKVLEEIRSQNLPERARLLGDRVQKYLHDLQLPDVKDIRGRGLMIAIEFNTPGFGAKLMDALRGCGVLALPSGDFGQCLSITPSLNIPEELLFDALDRIATCINQIN